MLNANPALSVKYRFPVYLLFVVFLLSASSLFSQTCELLTVVRNAVIQISPFSVEFTQQVFYDQELSIEESGVILFQDVKKIRWEYRDPDVKVAVIKGDTYKFYEEDSNQLTIGKINTSKKKWIWQLLFADEISNSIQCDENKKIIYLKDQAADMDFEVHIGEGNLLSKVIHRDPTGALNVYLFDAYKKKIAVSEEDFEIKLPENAEVVHAEDL